MTTSAPIILGPGEGDQRSFLGGGLHTWKLLATDTGGTFFLFEDSLTTGKCTPLHLHPEADETVYVLEGEIVSEIEGEQSRIGAGSMTFVPKGVQHAFVVVSDVARLLTFQTPGIGQAFYRDASEPATEGLPYAVDVTRVQASAHDNPRAVTLLGPPPFAAQTATN